MLHRHYGGDIGWAGKLYLQINSNYFYTKMSLVFYIWNLSYKRLKKNKRKGSWTLIKIKFFAHLKRIQ